MAEFTTWAGVQVSIERAPQWRWCVRFRGRNTAVERLVAQLREGVPEHEYRVLDPAGTVLLVLVTHNVLLWFALGEAGFAAAYRVLMARPWPTEEPETTQEQTGVFRHSKKVMRR